ncbi:RdgB/HAM1 family non-canonical purine NTP pyrophosphatase [Neoroseomonas oryzicola]|uniref:dITP/XTP pyrophosphatase n=1 Tax=Neoroseomonas oryzicola TaxID=535904 RepID=A0A9X9WNX7_9PROT|nr:RdgB/HAM1 family non-canonical purine NTP pyrophosphatase [Neoroseomonas oryzicola]MBR0662037.1 RdgB/HAM1 family non-canonical purine NTP pyrophosphatase [Neoroseomonas oryzicola]NKE18122.1 RdgB/HAM1 family non-canonical purine NTP pyrophosphatase [Neoroseomonas oryzicola]
MTQGHRRLARGERIVIATHNKGKLREVAALLAPFGIETVSAGELGLPEPDETEDSFIGNATIKATAAARAARLPALADDSGFSVAALAGAPGVRTADWAMQPDGSRDYADAMRKVMEAAQDFEDRTAWFSCALVLAWPDGHVEAFEGRALGHWVWPPRGSHGFGYDPMFVPDRREDTFGEIDPAEKHRISHRAKAFGLLSAACLPAPA